MKCWFFFVDISAGISATVIDHANKLEYSSVMKRIASDTSGVNYIHRSSHSQSNPSIKNSTICFSLVIFCLARRNAKVCEFEVADQIFRKDEMR